MTVTLSVDFKFSASHRLPVYVGKCNRLHGHNYRLRVRVRGVVDPITGMVADFHDIESQMHPLLERVDHHHLNELVENPTAENVVVWMWEQLVIPGLVSLELWETEDYSVLYSG
jgi:6-pyruvoyltetrahydropterin/6-carboxytetrahydropterin synthase